MPLELEEMEKEAALESIFGYHFNSPELRNRAITRKAWMNDRGPGKLISHPGLATLGDAVIGLCVVNYFFVRGKTPEEITNEKGDRVSRPNHTKIARNIGLKNTLKLGNCEGKTTEWDDGDALGEGFEVVVGAIYLDCQDSNGDGIEECERLLISIGLL